MFTVLILEDDYEQQKAVSKIINEHYKDWQIFIAGTYKEACNLTSTKCFDLFLLDIELKHENENDLDCDGLDFGKYIRSIEHYLYTPTWKKTQKGHRKTTSFDLKFFIQIPRWNPSGDRSVFSYDTLLYMQL